MRKIRFFSFSLSFILCLSLICHGAYGYEGVYTNSDEADMKIALTFDDGPHVKYTEQILEILDKYNIKATFFVIGCNAEKHPEKVKKIADSGHEIGNHTYSHLHLNSCSYQTLDGEIKKASLLISKITGKTPTLFRPPEGKCNKNIVQCAKDNGCSVILWSIDTRDWSHRTSDKIADSILKDVKSGDIILFHDFITPDTPTPDALEKIIPTLLEKGYKFCRVSELIG